MFGNLVRVELIRLFHNKALKACGVIGLFLILFYAILADGLISMGALEIMDMGDDPSYAFKIVLFATSFALAMTIVAPMTVISTTCEYQTLRLAVNFEGTIRNRFKLCLSEITGIVIFVLLLNLLVFPGVLITFLGEPVGFNVLINDDALNPLLIYVGVTLVNLYYCIVVYLISKLVARIPVAVGISVFLGVFEITLLFFGLGITSGIESTGASVPDVVWNVLAFVFLGMPVIVPSIMLAVKYRRTDRI
ncbi:MAG: hypothetical protein IJ757_06540 [Clostridiales bacterium]|nr:hypothetical protein [Clostridiales bacterium]